MNNPNTYIDVTAPPSGSAGDGETDDSAAFQRAVDSIAVSGEVILSCDERPRFRRTQKPDA